MSEASGFVPVDYTLRSEIEDLVTRYATAIDRQDWKLLRSIFTTDAHIDYGPMMGVWDDADEFTAFMSAAHQPAGRSLHRMTNTVISAGETISARTYGDSLILYAADESTGDHGAASYDDTFVRTDAGLKIAQRITNMVLFEKIVHNNAVS